MKFPECSTCYYNFREPTICDGCIEADQYERDDADTDSGMSAKRARSDQPARLNAERVIKIKVTT